MEKWELKMNVKLQKEMKMKLLDTEKMIERGSSLLTFKLPLERGLTHQI